VDYSGDVSEERASSIFRVTDSRSRACKENTASVLCEIWRKSGQSEPWEGTSKERKRATVRTALGIVNRSEHAGGQSGSGGNVACLDLNSTRMIA
jgi:hypothetical protein